MRLPPPESSHRASSGTRWMGCAETRFETRASASDVCVIRVSGRVASGYLHQHRVTPYRPFLQNADIRIVAMLVLLAAWGREQMPCPWRDGGTWWSRWISTERSTDRRSS